MNTEYPYSKENIKFMQEACKLCDHSTCGYKTGCIAVLKGDIVFGGWNETLPGETYCTSGDCIRETRCLKGGKEIEKVCSIHAESSVIAQAASSSVSLKDCDIYSTTFPCLICARLLSKTGIKNLFYMSDYTDDNMGMEILLQNKINVIQIPEYAVWEKSND